MEIRVSGIEAARPPSVLDYCERGRRTRRAPPLPLEGPPVEQSGLSVAFSLECDGLRVCEARFRATACTTLLAYCQLAVEIAEQRTLGEIVHTEAEQLVRYMRGVPAIRHDRAVLATAAIRAAAEAAERHSSVHSENQS